MYKLAIAVAFGLVVAAPAMAASGDDCTGDCAEGYLWAQENEVTTPNACTGKSAEFAAGCRAYLDDTTRGGTDEGGDDTD